MATFPSTVVEEFSSENPRITYIINKLMSSQMMEFWQIGIYYETGNRMNHSVKANSYKFSYQNWNVAFEPEVYLNGSDMPLNKDMYVVDFINGIVTLNIDLEPGDNVQCSYNFCYFPLYQLEGYITRALSVCNTAGDSMYTEYTLDNAPAIFDGIMADLSISMCMEKLLLDYDLWKGRLIFAIGAESLYSGSDNISGQLETIKRNCEERAYKSLDNPKLRVGQVLSYPTRWYWEAIHSGIGLRGGMHGNGAYGLVRGLKINKGVYTGAGNLLGY